MSFVGTPVPRREDQRLITGHGMYADDVPITGALHAAFVRSPYAHARILGIDTSAAEQAPGVTAVVTDKDIPVAGPDPRPLGIPLPPDHPDVHIQPPRLMATDKAIYVGEPVAIVLADSAYAARDAAGLVEVEYEPLDAVADPETATNEGVPLIHEGLGTNQAFSYGRGTPKEELGLDQAEELVRLEVKHRRLAAVPLEPRAIVAQYDGFTDGIVVYASTQGAHALRATLAAALGIPEQKIRVITRDVGGGFGLKLSLYPDEAAVVYLAWKRHCTIRWVETRSENLQAMAQGRGQTQTLTLGLSHDGKFQALEVDVLNDAGAFIPASGAVPGLNAAFMSVGPYAIPNAYSHVTGVYTNRAPTAPYRGAGRPEAIYALERIVDVAARRIGMDPAEIRRRNLIPPDAFPYDTPTGMKYDSGNYELTLDKALAEIGYDALRAEQAKAREEGRYLGIGLCVFVEPAGSAAWESGTVRVSQTGKVTVLTGSSNHGQGHYTTFAQIVADAFGLPMEDIEVIHGDTAAVPVGVGTFGSRSTALGGSAALKAAEAVRAKMAAIAANMLEARVEDIESAGGRFFVSGTPSRGVPFRAVAMAAYSGQGMPAGMELGLDVTEFFNSPDMQFPFGTHAVAVEVDANTGEVHILRYVAVDDCGTIVNPLLVKGQIQGGIAQGLGQALLEQVVYDESGQLASGSLMDYALPKAEDMPRLELNHTVTPTPLNPLGAKGVGEAGTTASFAAIVNAVCDALAPLGIEHIDMPLTAPRVWAAIQEAKGGAQ